MTISLRADFYVLADALPLNRFNLACQLAEKAIKQQMKVYILVANSEEGASLDELLWAYRPDSFLPHALQQEALEQEAGPHQWPILIGEDKTWQQAWQSPRELLINLSLPGPDHWDCHWPELTRVIEIINQQSDIKQAGRARYAYYRQRGIMPNHFNLPTTILNAT